MKNREFGIFDKNPWCWTAELAGTLDHLLDCRALGKYWFYKGAGLPWNKETNHHVIRVKRLPENRTNNSLPWLE